MCTVCVIVYCCQVCDILNCGAVGLAAEGVDLGRNGKLSLLQVSLCYTVSKKTSRILVAIISSSLSQFSKFAGCCREYEICCKLVYLFEDWLRFDEVVATNMCSVF